MSFTILQELKLGADSLYGITIEQREVMLMFQVTTLIIF